MTAVTEAFAKRLRRRQAPAAPDGLPDALHPVLRRLLHHRGVHGAEQLEHDLRRLQTPDALSGLTVAVRRLQRALADRERVLVVGDFDADGATSAAVCVGALRAMGAGWVDFLVPNRFEFGYGLSPELAAVAARQRPNLLITVDNGVSSVDGVATANAMGMDVIITDHHLPGAQLPAAVAIINPNLSGDGFPSKHLAGVGVVFYLLMALRTALREAGWFAHRPEPKLGEYLDLVALGTVADLVPLDHNNRILVEQGLRRIRAGLARPGIQALAQVAGRDPKTLAAADFGFGLAPRLNAAGRLQDMRLGIECLLAPSLAQALPLAQQLDALNRERRVIEADMKQQALALVEGLEFDGALGKAVSLFDPQWHEGVVGIVAARVKDQVHRPVVAFARSQDGLLKGSGRSIPGLHLRDALALTHSRRPGLIRRFGGHAMAAGLVILEADFAAFNAAFEAVCAQLLADRTLEGVVWTDGALPAACLTVEFARAVKYLMPWGQGLPTPRFDGEFEVLSRRLVGQGEHLTMMLKPLGDRRRISAIAFNFAGDMPAQGARLTLAYQLDVNDYQGETRLQLLVDYLAMD